MFTGGFGSEPVPVNIKPFWVWRKANPDLNAFWILTRTSLDCRTFSHKVLARSGYFFGIKWFCSSISSLVTAVLCRTEPVPIGKHQQLFQCFLGVSQTTFCRLFNKFRQTSIFLQLLMSHVVSLDSCPHVAMVTRWCCDLLLTDTFIHWNHLILSANWGFSCRMKMSRWEENPSEQLNFIPGSSDSLELIPEPNAVAGAEPASKWRFEGV